MLWLNKNNPWILWVTRHYSCRWHKVYGTVFIFLILCSERYDLMFITQKIDCYFTQIFPPISCYICTFFKRFISNSYLIRITVYLRFSSYFSTWIFKLSEQFENDYLFLNQINQYKSVWNTKGMWYTRMKPNTTLFKLGNLSFYV